MSYQNVGWDEIAGDDEYVGLDEIAGAPQQQGPSQARVRPKGYTKARKQMIGINSAATIAAAAQSTITVAPQTLFRGRKLIVGAALGVAFTIDDIKVGNVSQMAASGSVIADAFLPTATGQDNISMDTCPPGMSISITVTNISAGALTFRGALFGDSVQ